MAEGTQVLDTVFGNTTVIKLVAFEKSTYVKAWEMCSIYLFICYPSAVCLSMFIYLIVLFIYLFFIN